MNELGELLRGARERKCLTIPDAARATRIKPSFLEALELGEYALLPGPAYITGFLRNYASYLGLHPDDVVQEYHAVRPPPQPTVRAATRVLANGHERQNRSRLLWTLATLVLVLAAAYAIKQYNDASAHSYNAPLKLTAETLGASTGHGTSQSFHHSFRLRLHAVAPVWIRVTVDGRRVFQGVVRARAGSPLWVGHRAIYVVTYDGAHLKAVFNGRPMGLLATRPGLVVDMATPSSWQRIS